MTISTIHTPKSNKKNFKNEKKCYLEYDDFLLVQT